MITGKAPTELVEILRPWFIEGWVPIAQSTLTGAAASVTFSSIPADFRTLVLISAMRTDRVNESDAAELRFNADAGNNYDYSRWSFDGAAATATSTARAASSIAAMLIEGASARANNFSLCTVVIPNYNISTIETQAYSRGIRFGDRSADADIDIFLAGGAWRNQNAITSVTWLPTVGPNFVSGCIFQLYGIR